MPFFIPAIIAALAAGTGIGIASHSGSKSQDYSPYEKDPDFSIPPGRPKPRYTGPSAMDKLKAELERAKQRQQQRNSQQRPGNSITDILSRLEQLQDPSRYLQDQASIEQQAISQASAQYDPLIAALRNQMGAARGRASNFDTQLNNMYTALSSSLQADVPKVQEIYAQTKTATQGEYDKLQQQVQQGYDQSRAEQEAMYKRLNIEAAAPDTLVPQMRDAEFFKNIAASQAQTQQAALGLEERGATEFSRKGSEIAQFEGTNRRADLGMQLQELLGAYEAQIGQHEAAKSSAIASARNKMSSEAQQLAMEMAQRDFENYIKSVQLGRDLRGDELKGGGVVKSPADIANRALNMGLNQGSAQRIQNAFMSALGSDEELIGGLNPVSGTPATKEALARRVVERARGMGMSQQELNAIQIMALEYFGRA